MKITDIKTGTRHRKELGDIDALAESIRTVGLLHPIVTNAGGELIAGERRLAACKKLGWAEVAVNVAKTLDDARLALLAERDENTCRLDFAPSEAVALSKALKPLERKAAEERQASTRKQNVSVDRPVKLTERGETRKKIASAVGMGQTTLAKATAVVDAAEKHPKDYAPILEKMDRTGKVDAAYRTLAKESAKEGKPTVKLPHRVSEPESEEDYPPLPPGPSLQEKVRQDPVLRIREVFIDISAAVMGFTNGKLEDLRKAANAQERGRLRETIKGLIEELKELSSKLE